MPKVAFINNDFSSGQSLTLLAESAGLRANHYSSVDSFLNEANIGEVNCVVLIDQQGHEISGEFHAARSLAIPTILLSSSDEEASRERARILGATAFFREPVDGEALLDAIRWAIDSTRSEGRKGPHWGKSNLTDREERSDRTFSED